MRFLMLSLLVACGGGSDDDAKSGPTDGSDTDTDTDTDADADADTDTDSDTDTDTDTDPPTGIQVTALSWTPHAEQASLIWASWEQDVAGEVTIEVEVDPGIWRQAPPHFGLAGPNDQLIVGIPYGEDAEWRIVNGDGVAVSGSTITVPDLPAVFPAPQILVSDPSRTWTDAEYLMGSVNQDEGGWVGGTYWLFIMDRDGRIVWARPTPDRHWTIYAQLAVTGDRILYDDATAWVGFGGNDGADGQVHSIYLDQDIESFDTPGLHHAFIQMPDGSLVWGSRYHVNNTESLVMQPPGGADQVLWDCRSDWPTVGYCESNCIVYDEGRDTFMYSFYTNNSMVEIDRLTGQSLWWSGEVPGGFTFDPPEAQHTWQHGLDWTGPDTLLLSTEDFDGGRQPNIFAREYQIDTSNGVLTQIWSYDSGTDAGTNGDTHRLPNGNTLHAVGSSGRINEVAPDGTIVWHAYFPNQRERLLGRVEPLLDLYALVSDDAR